MGADANRALAPGDDLIPLIVIGLVAGGFSALFGVGGGVVIVPLLILLLAYDPTRATATSLAAIVITASVAGHVALPGSLYSATKHAARSIGESARKELLTRGVRTTLISPGNVDTPFFDNQPDVYLDGDDVARAVMFAVSQPPSVGINEILMRHPRQDV